MANNAGLCPEIVKNLLSMFDVNFLAETGKIEIEANLQC